jgi:hypothetical protein
MSREKEKYNPLFMRLKVLAAAAIGLACVVVAQSRTAYPAPEYKPTSVILGQSVPQATPPKEWGEIAARLTAIDSAVTKLTQKSGKTDITPALFGLLGVFVGGLINWFMQRVLLDHQRSLANKAALQEVNLANAKEKLEIGNSFVQWQLKQLSELYGPIHALLRQSNAMYRLMNLVLTKAEPERFRLRQGSPGDDFDKKVFEIKIDDQWVRFRTIMHISKVYGKDFGIEAYFDEVVAIGGRMVKVIEEKAGYARPEQKDLSSIFGRYLAHYSVLRRLHASVKAAVPVDGVVQASHFTPEIVVDQSAVFPTEIQGLVDAGFDALNNDLSAWHSKAMDAS